MPTAPLAVAMLLSVPRCRRWTCLRASPTSWQWCRPKSAPRLPASPTCHAASPQRAPRPSRDTSWGHHLRLVPLIGGVIKLTYDLLFLSMFASRRPEEESSRPSYAMGCRGVSGRFIHVGPVSNGNSVRTAGLDWPLMRDVACRRLRSPRARPMHYPLLGDTLPPILFLYTGRGASMTKAGFIGTGNMQPDGS